MSQPPLLQPPASHAIIHLAWAARLMRSPGNQAAGAGKPSSRGRNGVLRPLPQLDSADKVDLDDESRMRLAVALDVVCSATRKLEASASVLDEATRAWLGLRGRQLLAADLEQLIQKAHSPQATARARVSGGLIRTLLDASGPGARAEEQPPAPLPTTTPQSVAAAHRTIEAAGEAVVAEMTLWLADREKVDYRRA